MPLNIGALGLYKVQIILLKNIFAKVPLEMAWFQCNAFVCVYVCVLWQKAQICTC